MTWVQRSLGMLASYLGIGLVTLYIIGITGTVGRIQASGVAVGPALARVPLEEHLRNGVAVFVNTSVWAVFIGLAALLLAAFSPEVGPGQANPPSRQRGRAARVCWDWFLGLVLVVGVLFVLVTWPWVDALVLIAAIAPVALAIARPHLLRSASSEHPLRVYFYVALGTTVFSAFAHALWAADPLPEVRVSSATGETTWGPLISVNDGVIYIGARSAGGVLYRGTPTDGTRIFVVSSKPRREPPSLLNSVGIDWR